jgi:hypothetical protein
MEPIQMMFYTLQHLKHFVRTAFGISSNSFQANNVNQLAIQGIGQGNGAGPQVRAAISTVLLEVQVRGGIHISDNKKYHRTSWLRLR